VTTIAAAVSGMGVGVGVGVTVADGCVVISSATRITCDVHGVGLMKPRACSPASILVCPAPQASISLVDRAASKADHPPPDNLVKRMSFQLRRMDRT